MVRRPPKYQPEQLLKMLRIASQLRNQMLDAGFTDNGGAIHSAERILNILGMRLVYPDLSHINNLRHLPTAEFSRKAKEAHAEGERVLIEHVSPLRALTQETIRSIDAGATDSEIAEFVKSHYRLVLLTADETSHLNKLNRSRMDSARLASAGIDLIEVPPK